MLQFATTKLMTQQCFQLNETIDNQPSTISYTLRFSHHILKWYPVVVYTLFLKPDMELELELSLIFGQKHSEKNQQICIVLVGLYVPFNGRSQGCGRTFGDLRGGDQLQGLGDMLVLRRVLEDQHLLKTNRSKASQIEVTQNDLMLTLRKTCTALCSVSQTPRITKMKHDN